MIKVKAQAGITILAGLSLILIAALSLGLLGDAPTILSPASILLIIPLMMWPHDLFIILIPPVLFWLWSSYLFRGSPGLPKRMETLGYIIAALSLFYFASNWPYDISYQRLRFTIVCVAGSVAFAILFILVVRRYSERGSFSLSLFASWLLFVWVFTYAFPYLG